MTIPSLNMICVRVGIVNLWVNSRMDPYNIKVRSLSGDLSSMLLLSSC